MSATDFLPRRQQELLDWSRSFRNQLLADPAGSGVTAAMATEYAHVHDQFAAAYRLAVDPSTQSKQHTLIKNEAQKKLRALARRYSKYIQTRGLSNERKQALGLTIARPGGWASVVPPPTHAPRLFARIERGRVLHLRLRDAQRSTRRGRPDGVRGALLYAYFGGLPTLETKSWHYLGTAPRTNVQTVLPLSLEPGTPVWVTARWVNPRMQRGPMALPQRVQINYDTPPRAVEVFCEGIREIVRQHPYTRKDYYQVWLQGLGASGLEILVYIFHEAPDWQTELRERHRFLLDVMRLARRLGVEFAFPTQTLHLNPDVSPAHAERSDDADRPEPHPGYRGDEPESERAIRTEARRAVESVTGTAPWRRERPGPYVFDRCAAVTPDDETQIESKVGGDGAGGG